jgi:hypothetical protein
MTEPRALSEQDRVRKRVEMCYHTAFYTNCAQRTIKLPGGEHEFDLLSSKASIVGEFTKYSSAEKLPRSRVGARPALIVTIVAIVTLTVILHAGNVYAQTLILTPNQVTQGMNVQVTGREFQPLENGQIQVYTDNAGTCAVIPVMTLDASTSDNGTLGPVTIQTGGLSAGTYCVEANGFLDFPAAVYLTINAATTTTPAALQMPGFPIEAIFIGIVLGLVATAASRRRKDTQEITGTTVQL